MYLTRLNPLSPSSHEVNIFDESGENLPCVGTIISSYLILTLASCLYGNGNGKGWNKLTIMTRAKSGSGLNSNSNSKWDEEEEEQVTSNIVVSRVIFHTDFKNSSLENDVAFLVLDEKDGQNLNLMAKIIPILRMEESGSGSGFWSTLTSLQNKKNKRESPSAAPDGVDESANDYDVLISKANIAEADGTKNTEIDDYDVNIAGGVGVLSSERLPYQLSIRYQGNPPDGAWQHICGATILDETTALTAAHCFTNSIDPGRYRVVAGEFLLDTPEKKEQVLPVRKIIIHPDYTDFKNGRDIAILHVDKFQFNKYARGVWLSPFSNEQLSNKMAVISGWGQISNGAAASNSLQKGNVSILSPEDCRQRIEDTWKFPIEGRILCALNPAARSCEGDSGGPLVIQNYALGNSVGNLLVGIVSFGATDCERPNTAGGFTEISYFYDWIQQNRAKTPCDEQNQLPCVTGGCYTSDLKCDKEQDCLDGTDEINCLTSCAVAKDFSPSPRDTIQFIHPYGNHQKLGILCDFNEDGGGWTIIQKRASGPKEEFYRGWNEYKNGFGSLSGNFWRGLDIIHTLTQNGDQELRIDLEDWEGNKVWAKYSSFSISDASDNYRLAIGGYYGNSTAGDSLTGEYNINGTSFSTKDKDNDGGDVSCAQWRHGAWWYRNFKVHCAHSNLNGWYWQAGEFFQHGNGMVWESWRGKAGSLNKVEMKIRKRN